MALTAHETSDLSPRAIVAALAGILVLIGAVALSVLWLLHAIERRVAPRSLAPFPVESVSGPPLEVDPAAERVLIEARGRARIASYGWVDRSAGIARVPVERAMAILAERGWPEDAERWSAWLVEEERWLAAHDEQLAELRHEPDVGRVVASLQELSAHRALRRELAPQVEPLLQRPEASVVAAAAARFERAYRFLTEGYRKDVDELFNEAYFDEEYDEMVLVKDIEFYSLCEHHLLPFFGKVHVAYLPRRKIVGLSKIPRLVDLFARRLQVQERMTKEIAEMMMERLDPLGVAVVVEARHLCMVMRGVEKQHSTMTTSHMLGNFRDHQPTRLEFMNLIACQGA